MINNKKKNSNYISIKESRAIIKHNILAARFGVHALFHELVYKRDEVDLIVHHKKTVLMNTVGAQ